MGEGELTGEELSGGNGGGGGVSRLSAKMGRNRGSRRGAVRERGSGECSTRICVVQEEKPSGIGEGGRQWSGAGQAERRPVARRPRARNEATAAAIGRSNQRE